MIQNSQLTGGHDLVINLTAMPISSPAGVKEASRPIENEEREDLLLNQDVHLMLEDFIFWLSLAIRAGVDASRVCSGNTAGCITKRDAWPRSLATVCPVPAGIEAVEKIRKRQALGLGCLALFLVFSN